MRKTTGPVRTGVKGRQSVFRGKGDGLRVQGMLTREGGRLFEVARAQLQKLVEKAFKRPAVAISDADTIEFLAMGELETWKYLSEQARLERRRTA